MPAEGFIDFLGYRTWYKVVGPKETTHPPMVVVHGGPGIPHDYLEPLEALATDRRLVFYDQLGCGRSDRPEDPSLWSVETFTDEIQAVREALGLDSLHLFGHSMGGTLALNYALRQPAGVLSLVLASAVASVPAYLEEGLRQIDRFGPGARETVLQHERAGTTDDPKYRAVFNPWMAAHMMRAPLEEWPEALNRAFAGMGTGVYGTLWAGGQFTPTGPLKDVDISARLAEIAIPALLVHGEHDFVSPALGQALLEAIPEARLEVVGGASHLGWFEQPERFLGAVRSWLEERDRILA